MNTHKQNAPRAKPMTRVMTILKKDLKRAPQTGIVFLAVLYPVMITAIVHLVFGSIFDPLPRIGIIDKGDAVFTAAAIQSPAVKETLYAPDEEEEMWDEVRAGRLDLGIIIEKDHDQRVRNGETVEVKELVSTRANYQAMFKLEAIAVKVTDEMGLDQGVNIEYVKLSDKVAKSWVQRLLPLILLLSFFIAGTFLTGFSIVDENMRGTMRAILTGPTKVSEMMLAKGLFSFGIAGITSLLTLWLNDALGSISLLLLLALALAAVMTIEFGIMVGFMSKDVNTLNGIAKGAGIFVVMAVMPYLWDGWSLWISKLNPLWYVINPIVGIVNDNQGFRDVALELGVGTALCIAFVFVAGRVARHRLRKLDLLG